MHDVPATGAQPQIDRGRVHHHSVTDGDGADQLCEHVRALRLRPEVDEHPLQIRTRLENFGDHAHPERRHRTRRRRYSEAINRSTRSSRDLNGSLQSTVRCAWSFSFRWTQSTV